MKSSSFDRMKRTCERRAANGFHRREWIRGLHPGRPDGEVTLDEVVAHTRALSTATTLPLSVDLENGYGTDPEHAARAIRSAAEAGAVGGSIEDYERSCGVLAV